MKKFIKSVFAAAAILCFMVSAAFAAPKDELDGFLKDMNKVNNGRVNLKADGKFLDDTFHVLAKINFESKPLTLIRGETEVTVYEKGDAKKAKKTSYEFYVEDNDKEYTYYYTEKGKNKWYKESVSNDDKKTEKDAIDTAVSKLDETQLGDLIGKIDYDEDFMGQAGKTNQVGYKVTVDVAKFAEIISAAALEGATKDEAEKIKVFVAVAKDLPYINYTIVGDKKKREIVSVRMPLTPFLHTTGHVVANSNAIDPMAKVIAMMALSNAELDIQADGKDYNKVKVEKLPDDVKKNAKQVEQGSAKK